jgi:hypothetical protein
LTMVYLLCLEQNRPSSRTGGETATPERARVPGVAVETDG